MLLPAVLAASNGLVLILLLGLVVGVVFVCGLYVGSAFMHEHSHTESDHRSAFYVFVENPKLRGAVRSFEGLFDGHRPTPPPANPHGKADSVVGPVPPSAPLPKPPAPAEPAAPEAPAPASQPAAAAAAAGAAAASQGSASSSQAVPLPSGKSADAVPSLQTDADRGAKLKSPYDSPSVTVSAWIYLPSDKSTRTMNTILANKASGCETSGERMGYALYVNTWETADRQLILEWGNSQSGCAKLGSGQGASLIEYDTWTHVAAVLEPTSAAIYINGKQVSESEAVQREHDPSGPWGAHIRYISPHLLVMMVVIMVVAFMQVAKSSPIERKVQESAPLKLGRNGDETYPFFGRIASVSIFTDALSESQIQASSPPPPPAHTDKEERGGPSPHVYFISRTVSFETIRSSLLALTCCLVPPPSVASFRSLCRRCRPSLSATRSSRAPTWRWPCRSRTPPSAPRTGPR